MKKWILPCLLFAAVFLTGWLCQPFTLICQEYEGLFLNTPDAWTRAFSQVFPLSGIVSDFLIQFYRDPVYGALVMATLVTLVFVLLRAVVCRFGFPGEGAAALGASATWFFLSRASEPKVAVIVLFFSLAAFLASRFFRVRPGKSWKGDLPIAATMVAAVSALTIFSPEIRRTEQHSRVKRDAIYGVWEDLLVTVPPSVAENNPELTPFALLALSAKGQLGDRMFSYPVYGENDLDMVDYDGASEYAGSILFKASLYQHLGCYNEAIHNFFQWATQLSKGTSFVVLRKLVELYYVQGNYTLMEKYCRILEHSLFNRTYVRHYRTLAAKGNTWIPEPASIRALIPVISHDPLYNLLLLESYGISSASSADRVMATCLLRNNSVQFLAAYARFSSSYSRIPRHFQEAALVFGGMEASPVEETVRERYVAFRRDAVQLSQQELIGRYKNTAFLYLSQED